MQRWGIPVGFLIAAVLGGSIDVAMRASATGTETSEKAVSLRAQGLAATPDMAKAVQSSPIAHNGLMTVQGPPDPKPKSDPTQEGGRSASAVSIRRMGLLQSRACVACPCRKSHTSGQDARIGCPTANPIRLASDRESGNAFAGWLIFAD